MKRQRIDLNGAWNFGTFEHDESHRPPRGERTIEVPRSYQSALEDLFSHTGYATYTRSGCIVPEDWFADEVVLHFDAVNYWCEVWVNGTRIGEHEGGYTPFEFRVDGALNRGEGNEIALLVLTPSIDDGRFPFAEIPHGKQDWYGPAGGIWQDVYVERRSSSHIEALRLTPEVEDKRVTAEVTLAGLAPTEATYELATSVVEHAGDGETVARTTRRLDRSATTLSTALAIDEPRLWSPEDPHRYLVRTRLYRDGALVDEWQ